DGLRIAEPREILQLFAERGILAQFGQHLASLRIVALRMLQFLLGNDAPALLPLQEGRHADQEAEHQEDHDLGHGQAEHQTLPVRRSLLQDASVHAETSFLRAREAPATASAPRCACLPEAAWPSPRRFASASRSFQLFWPAPRYSCRMH